MALFSFSPPRDLSFQNPVAQAEYSHLQRIGSPSWQIIRWMYLLLIGGGWLFAVYLAFQAVRDPYQLYHGNVSIGAILIMVIGLVLHFRLMTYTLNLAADTVVREKKAGTWETLLLTNVSAKQLVLGKWWAVIQITWKQYLLLGLLRATISISLGVVLLASDANVTFRFRDTPSDTPLFNIIAAAFIMVLMTLLNCFITAAAGVAGSLVVRRYSPSFVTAQAARMAAITLPVGLLLIPVFYVIIQLQPQAEARDISVWLELTMWIQITLLDNGTMLTGMLANPLDNVAFAFVPAAGIVAGIYIGLTFGLLNLGRFIARKQGASA